MVVIQAGDIVKLVHLTSDAKFLRELLLVGIVDPIGAIEVSEKDVCVVEGAMLAVGGNARYEKGVCFPINLHRNTLIVILGLGLAGRGDNLVIIPVIAVEHYAACVGNVLISWSICWWRIPVRIRGERAAILREEVILPCAGAAADFIDF